MVRTTDWLGQAEAELKAAGDLLATDNYAWCCFTAQQAAEKALKAILEHFRERTPGHNLNELAEAIGHNIAVDAELRAACARLNRLYIPTRYPDAFVSGVPAEQYFRADAEQALEDVERVVDFARTTLDSV